MFSLGAAITWGLVYTIDQSILRSASPFALLFVDSVCTSLLLLPFAFASNKPLAALWMMPGTGRLLIVASLALAALANFFIFSSIQMSTATTASVFEICYPFFVVLFSFLIFRTRPTLSFLIGALFIFAGGAIIIAFHR